MRTIRNNKIKFSINVFKFLRFFVLQIVHFFCFCFVAKLPWRLSSSVYGKPTHTNRYLHALSTYQPSQKISIIQTLALLNSVRASFLADELPQLTTAFRTNHALPYHALFKNILKSLTVLTSSSLNQPLLVPEKYPSLISMK